MPTVQKSIRIQQKTIEEIEQIARESGREFSTVTNELLEEAVRMLRCPGTIFSEGTTGRRARIAGTGLEVWEVIATYKGVGQNLDRLTKSYHWLTTQQLRSALCYYTTYPDEIELFIKRNKESTREHIHKRYPFLSSVNR
jgi:uncharacterized protein (DUF433 family)